MESEAVVGQNIDTSVGGFSFERVFEHIPDGLKKALEPALCAASFVLKGYYDISKVEKHLLEGNINKVANSALSKGIVISFIGLFFEVVKLYKFWGELCEAKEFANKGFHIKKAAIQAKLDKIPARLNKFAEGLKPSSFEALNAEQRLLFFVKKTRERDAVRKLLDEVEKDLWNLECQINGRICKLSEFSSYTKSAVVGQGLQAASLGVSAGILGPFSSPVTSALAGVTIAAHFATIMTRVILAKKAKNTVAALGKNLDELYEIRCDCEKQKEALDSLFEQFCEDLENNKAP